MSETAPVRRIQRVRHEVRRRAVEVRHVERLSPGFARITFGGAELEGFLSASFDDHVKLVFGGSAEPVMRDYTPRAFDAGRRELVIEFALHGHGHASEWARHAVPGQPLTVGGPRGSMVIPTDFDWHLLVADATGLPAIRRRLEELPAQARVIVIAMVAPEDRLPLPTQAQLELHWVQAEEELLARLRALQLPAGEGFAWCAGEAAAVPAIRRLLREHHGLPKEAMRVAAYWKRGKSSHHENLDD